MNIIGEGEIVTEYAKIQRGNWGGNEELYKKEKRWWLSAFEWLILEPGKA
jgi:hypothetical protein